MEIVEVGPRDGLQSEPTLLSTAQKVELIERLLDSGVRRLEAVSFVNPKRVPQMADADAVMAAVPKRPDVSYIGLVLNRRGFERALSAKVSEVTFVVLASDTFGQRNQGATIPEMLAAWDDVAAAAAQAGMPCGAVIGAAFGCPFEGEVPTARVSEIALRLAAGGAIEIGLADSIGVAAPGDVVERFSAVAAAAPGTRLRGHFHNTRNTGLANAYAALQAGAQALDSSIGGIGGCPFAPAATGNIPTEDLCYMLDRMGVATGLSVADLMDTTAWLELQLNRKVPAMLGKAGLFPRAA